MMLWGFNGLGITISMTHASPGSNLERQFKRDHISDIEISGSFSRYKLKKTVKSS